MILSTHALAGAVIGKNISSPWMIIVASLIIHYIMDAFRHGEYFDSRTATIKTAGWKVFLDLTIGGLVILIYFFFDPPSEKVFLNICLGSFFSMFPDLLTLIFWKFKLRLLDPLAKFHGFCHRYWKFPKFSPERQWTLRNVLNDILISLASIVALLLF